ncbi:hypothetical protein PIB30_072641, partial [Stylosanthes scabra]|nr:hypothetical protein [Stylosanthes scabra]
GTRATARLTAQLRGPKIYFWKAPATIVPSRVPSHAFAHNAQPRGTSARPHGGIGCFRTKFGLASCRHAPLNAPLHVSCARAVPLCDRATARVALGRNSVTSVRLRAPDRASARAQFQAIMGPQSHRAPARLRGPLAT